MARIEDIAVGDTVTVKFVVTATNQFQPFSVHAKPVNGSADDPHYGIKPAYVSSIDKPIRAGDFAIYRGENIEVLKVRGDTAIVLWDIGDIDDDVPLADMTKVAV